MNSVNPLHIGGLIAVVILFLFFKLSGAKLELVEATRDYKASEKLAVEVSALKSVYGNKKRVKKSLNRIFTSAILKPAKLLIQRNKNSIKISTKSISAKRVNYLMGKVLNGAYNITLLKIKRLSEEKAELEMEIKW